MIPGWSPDDPQMVNKKLHFFVMGGGCLSCYCFVPHNKESVFPRKLSERLPERLSEGRGGPLWTSAPAMEARRALPKRPPSPRHDSRVGRLGLQKGARKSFRGEQQNNNIKQVRKKSKQKSKQNQTQIQNKLENIEKVGRSIILTCLSCMAEPLLRSICGLGAAGATAQPHKNGFRRITPPHTMPPWGISPGTQELR